MSSVHLTLDRRWVTDPSFRRPPHGTPHHADPLMSLRGTIDLIVGPNNLTQSIHEARVVTFVLDLLDHLHTLHHGDARKHIQTFSDEPYELVLLRDDTRLLLSFYHLDLRGETLTHNLPVTLHAFSRACHHAAQELHQDLTHVFADNLNNSPLFARLTARLAAPLITQHVPSPPGPSKQSFVLTQESLHPLSWRVEGLVTTEDLLSYDDALRFDLHALLFSGTVRLEHTSGAFVLVDNASLLAHMLPLVRELERTLERRAAGPRWTPTSTTHHIRVEHLDNDRVRLTRGAQTFIIEEAQWVVGLCGVLDHLCAWILSSDARHARNQRIHSIRQRLNALTSWYQDWRSPPSPSRSPVEDDECITHHSGDFSIAAPTDFPFAVSAANLRRLICESVWSIEQHDSISRCVPQPETERLVIQSPQGWSGHDLSSGERVWHYALRDRSGGFSSALIGTRLLLAYADTVELLTLEQGRRQWRDQNADQQELHLEPDRVAMMVRQQESRLIAAIDDHRLRAWHADTGQRVWEHRLDHGELLAVLATGRRVVCCSDHGWLTALDAWHGEALWHRSSHGYPEHGPWHVNETLVVLSDDPSDDTGVLQAFALSTGQPCWTQRLESPPLTAVQLTPGQLLCTQSSADVDEWSLYDLDTGRRRWIIPAPTSLDPNAAQPWWCDTTHQRLFVLDHEGYACALALATGDVLWRTQLPTASEEGQRPHIFTSSDNTLWLFSGGLYLARPGDGHLTCRLDGLPEDPRTLTPLPSFELLVEEQDPTSRAHRWSLFRMGHFLALVD